MRVNDVRLTLQEKLAYRDFVVDKTGVKTLEIRGASFIADEPTIFGKINEDWARRETLWYHSISLNVNDIEPPVPEIWKLVSDGEGFINSNYGWMIFSEENGSQYDHVLAELKKNPDSRRAVMIYQRPSMWEDCDKNGRSDFCCTAGVQYFIRGELEGKRLSCVVQMRSNDLIFGYKGDYHWQRHVLQMLAEDLDVEPGVITWQVGSAHVYERHFFLVDFWGKNNLTHVPSSYYRDLYPDSEWVV